MAINMSLDSYLKERRKRVETQTQTEPQVEWDGKDFRGDRVAPKYVDYIKAHPVVFKWVRNRVRNTINNFINALIHFTTTMNITPEKFLTLGKKEARDLVWEFVERVRIDNPTKAVYVKTAMKSFYLYCNEEELVFIKGKHDIIYEPKRIKEHMKKEVCWKIIDKAKNLRDEAILIFAFESGLRRNAISHMTFGHYKKWQWFFNGKVAVFKVVAQKHKEYTHDNKLKGRGIHWYYACLHEEAIEIINQYVSKHHQNSIDKTPFWYSRQTDKGLTAQRFLAITKDCVKRASLDTKKINFHSLRRGFRTVVRNTATIIDHDYKEFIMGHKLKGSQDAYQTKDPKEIADEYVKCDFSRPAPSKEKEIKRLQEEVKALSEKRMEEKKEPLAIPDGPLGARKPIVKQPTESESPSLSSGVKSSEVLTQPTTTSPTKPVKDGWITCEFDGEPHQLIDLPCIKDVNFVCSKKVCKMYVDSMFKPKYS